MGIRKEDLFLRHESLREYQNMGGGTNKGGNPGGVNQRQNEHLGEDRRVIRMTYIAKRAGGDYAESGRVHHLNVPMFPEGANHPPAHGVCGKKKRETHSRKEGNEGPLQKNDFGRG